MWWKQNSTAKQQDQDIHNLFVRMNSGQVTEADQRYFEQWQWENPDRVAGYYELEGLWHELGLQTEELPPETIDALRKAPEPLLSRHREKLFYFRPAYVIAASVLLVVSITAVIFLPQSTSINYHTARGERLVVNLEDGSTVHLSSLTEISVNFDDRHRNITLLSGEALFEVTKDADREFIVGTKYGDVQVLGTAFNINTLSDVVAVTVVEGAVMVNPAKVAANVEPSEPEIATRGKQVLLASSGKVENRNVERLDQIVAWSRGKLIFSGEPLYQAVEQVNRHARHSISVKDPVIRNLPIHGVFNTGDASGFVTAIKEALPVRSLEISGNTTVLLSKN